MYIGAIGFALATVLVAGSILVRSRSIGKRLEKLVKQRSSELDLQISTLQTLVDSIPDLVFSQNANFKITLCNKPFLDFFGLAKDDVLAFENFERAMMASETAEYANQVNHKVINERQRIVYEEWLSGVNGAKRLFETIKAPLLTQTGSVVGIVGIARDITERKMMEEKLSLQMSTLQTMVDSIPDIVFCKDLDLNYTLCNKNLLEFFAISKDSIIGKNNITGLNFPAEVAKKADEVDLMTINQRQMFRYEEIIPSADGKELLFETIKAPLIQDGAVFGVVGIARDITERKELEEEARAASRLKSEFLATMSHEIRTPMNSIMGFAELALDSGSIHNIKDYLKRIYDSTKWLLHIINDILDISKIEAGKMELEKVPFNLRDVFSRCQSVILPSIKEKGLDLSIYAEPSIGKKLLGDPVRLYQVLMNLLGNAVKFTTTGTIRFSSSIKNADDGSATIYFEVKDTGIGMSPEQVDKVFGMFIQADSSTTRDYGGTGLGLAIAKNIVEMMGGKLVVESSPGVGSVFSFEITFNTIDTPEDTLNQMKSEMLEKPYFDALILVCDDNSLNQQVICAHLERIGIKTMEAENGKIGVEMVRVRKEKDEKPFDLIFMDMFMPVMDGMEAASKIIAMNTGTPIVAMTANVMVSELEKYKKNGMPDCLGKPFTAQELWRILLKYLNPVSSGPIEDDSICEENNELQKKLRFNFFKNNQTVHTEIIDAVTAGDTKLAHRIAHSLKGNAGLIGRAKLRKAAADVEALLQDGLASVWENRINILKTELMLVLEELKPQIEATEQEKSQSACQMPTQTTEQVLALFAKLKPMLENNNTDCMDLLDELRAVPGAEALVQQIDDFDFKSAVRTLVELKRKLEKSHE